MPGLFLASSFDYFIDPLSVEMPYTSRHVVFSVDFFYHINHSYFKFPNTSNIWVISDTRPVVALCFGKFSYFVCPEIFDFEMLNAGYSVMIGATVFMLRNEHSTSARLLSPGG